MLISQFARAAGLSTDTVRFYVRKGLLRPTTTSKGGSNPYQIFKAEDVEAARTIRMAQALGFTLREIAQMNDEYQSGRVDNARATEILGGQLVLLEDKARQLADITAYIRVKLAWLQDGAVGPAPRFPGDSGTYPAGC